jgi:hypothetical protein
MKKLMLLAASSLLAGCTQTVHMYPIEGPLSEIKPLPEIKAIAQGVEGNTGKLSFTRPDGVSCSGRWSSAAPQMAGVVSSSLFTSYGTAAGFGVVSGPAPGVNRGQAFGTCSNNATFEVEFYTGSGTANGYGLAKDKDGNVYKLIF